MTLTKLAELCGTSIATVSKAFAGSREISIETRNKIFQVARELGLFDKYYKGPHEAPLIALVFPESESEFYANQIGLLERELSLRGADTVIALTRFDKEREARLFRELAYRMRVDGIIVSGGGALIKNPDEIPLVTIGGKGTETNNADGVKIDQESGIMEAVALVKQYGHREVGFIGEPLTASRLRLFKSAMRLHGLPVREELTVTSKKRFDEAGEDGMRKILDGKIIPSVIFAAYDSIAYGAMKFAREAGLKIPDDISFIGVDDSNTAEHVSPALSSIHIHLEDASKSIVDLIFKRMENRHYRSRTQLTVRTSLCLRESLKSLNG